MVVVFAHCGKDKLLDVIPLHEIMNVQVRPLDKLTSLHVCARAPHEKHPTPVFGGWISCSLMRAVY